jgi:ATP-binding cassette, subfamily B, bacterial
VLITHRLANVRHADRIYVIHDGHIVESGTHAELIASSGRYAELFRLQAAGYLEQAGSLDASRPRPAQFVEQAGSLDASRPRPAQFVADAGGA